MAAIPITSNPMTVTLSDNSDNTLEIDANHPLFGGARHVFFIKVITSAAGVRFNTMGVTTNDSPLYVTDEEVPPITAGPNYPVHVKGANGNVIEVAFING